MEKIKKLYLKYREIISYVFWGVMTTVVNWVVYFPLNKLLDINYLLANTIAWITAVLFAFVTNRIFVFRSQTHGFIAITRELVSFFVARLTSFGIEQLLMYLGVDVLKANSDIIKIIVAVVVVILNYVFSKLFVFAKRKGNSD